MTQADRLTVLAVSPVAEAGGAETLLLDVLVGLHGDDIGIALLVLGDGPLAGLAGSRGVRVLTGPALSFRRPVAIASGVAAVRRSVRAVRPDIVLASHPKGQVICRLATVGDMQLTHVAQLYDPPSPASVSIRVAARLSGLRLSITDETAAAYRALRSGLDPVVIPPGTDRERLLRDARAGDGERAWTQTGLRGPGPRVVMFGRLQRFKGPHDFISMASAVSASHPDARFLVIGPDSPVEPDLRAELEATIVAGGLRGSVALAGRLSAADLAATVAGATLLVHPAHREPFGLAVVEALALGTPVVAYAAPGPASILETGGGELVAVGDVDGLARAVARALDDPDTLARWSAGTGPTSSRFDVTATVARYRQVLTEATSNATRTGPPALHSIGVAPAQASCVRDYGSLLDAELRSRGIAVTSHWFENDGDRLTAVLGASARLVGLGLTLPRTSSVIWHYSPVSYGFRGLPIFGVLVGVALRARRCRVVSVLHELAYAYRPDIDRRRAWVKAFVQELALRVVLAGSAEIVVTTDLRGEDVRRRARPGAGLRVIPVFPTIPVRRAGRPSDAAGRPFVIGVPGYAGDGVRPDILLEALNLLGLAGEVRVVLLGAPGPGSADGRRWSQLAIEHGCADCLEFTGVVDPEELSRRFAESVVVVLVNEEGPSGRKTTLAAALAHGLPVVSLDGYNRWDEVIEAGALQVVPADASALASALAALRDSPTARAALGMRGAAFADAHMSLRVAADAFVGLLADPPASACRGERSGQDSRRGRDVGC